MKNNEIDLVRKTLSGDKSAFDRLVKSASPLVFSIIYRFFHEKQQAEDIAQEVFIRAYRSLHTYGQEKPFTNWLSTITVRMCYRELKKEKNNPEKTEASLTSENYSIIDSFCFNPESLNSMDPEKKLILKELAEKILTKLLAKERMIIVLTEVEGRSIKEVSNLMGISTVNVKVSNYRARKNARKILNSLIKKQV
jgi:RNA polymerase sigma-70 factor (ECF subfamily)